MNPVNIVSHLAGTNDDLSSRPTTLYGVAQISDDVGDASGWAGMVLLLAVLNVFVGVFNMFPLLPLDGGHAAIAAYERVREKIRGGKQRYFADVERLMPFAMGVVTVLVMLMFAGLLVIPGSHKAVFSRPRSLFYPYGNPPGLGGPNRPSQEDWAANKLQIPLPDGCFHVRPEPGDVVTSSE